MKYYLYISDNKIDMLWPQIQKKKLSRISTRLNINLKLLELSFGKEPTDETRYSRLAVIEDYIRANFELGTLDHPRNYFTGSMAMSSGLFSKENFEYVFFCGEAGGRHIALVGSPKHIVGQYVRHDETKSSPYFPGPPLETLEYHINQNISGEVMMFAHNIKTINENIESLHRQYRGQSQQVEFLSRLLLEGPKFVLGTPLYVALVD